MPIKFTTKGFIELWRGSTKVSQHSIESEAVERAVSDSEQTNGTFYTLKYPNKDLDLSRLLRVIKDIDATRPNIPTGLQATPTSETAITLSWNAATDGTGLSTEAVSGIAGYRLYRNGTLRVQQAGLTFGDTGLSAYTVYSYTVSAYDAAGNESFQSPAITPRTLDTTAPTAPTITATSTGTTSISVALTTPSTDTLSGVSSYALEYKRTIDSTWTVNGTGLTAANFPRSISGLTSSTQYDTRCRATDVSGNAGAYSATSQATTQASASIPVWQTVPTVTFVQGTASYFDYGALVTNAQTITKNGIALPSGVTNNTSLRRYVYDGVGAVGGTNGHILTADNASTDDWLTRSASAAFANRLQTQSDLTSWVLLNGREANCTLDTSTKVPGAAGSFRIANLNTAGPDSGDIGVPIGPYGNGTTVWVSYRVRAPKEFTYQPWVHNAASGQKLSILSHSSSSNQVNEVVIQQTNQLGTFTAYHQDGGSFPSFEVGFSSACSASDVRDQPSVDRGANLLTGTDPDTGLAWSSCQQQARQYGPLYARWSSPGTEAVRYGFGDPLTGAFRFVPDTWITVTFRVVIGTFGSANSAFTMWCALDGQPYVKLIDSSGMTLGAGPDYNRLWLLSYVTNRSGGGRRVSSISGISGVSAVIAAKGTHLGAGVLEYTASTGRFRFRTALDSFGAAHAFSSVNGITTINLTSSSHGASTTLFSTVTLPASTITLTDGSSFPTAGTIVLGSPDGTNPAASHGNGEQLVQYTGRSGNVLTGCTGGVGIHDTGVPVKVGSYIALQLDNAALLPTSGVTSATITIADGRGDTAINYNDLIVQTGSVGINAPGGFAPT